MPSSSSKQTPSRVPFFRQVVKGLYSKTAFFALAAVPVVILGLRWHARREAQKLANIPLRKLVEKADAQGRERNLILPLATDMIRVVYAGDAESDDRPVMVVHVRSPQGAKAHGATGKNAAAGRRDAFAAFNPLAVTELFGTHKVVLNKFPLMRNHVVVHTLDFVPQSGHMSLEDMQATWHCTRELEGIAFFNSGEDSGASQPRRHMQVIPIDSIERKHGANQPFPPVPVERLIHKFRQARDWKYEPGKPFALPEYDFQHAVCLHGGDVLHMVSHEAAGVIHRNYQTLLKAVGLGPDDGRSYNLLFTESWMMVVPRSREKWQGVGFNSMAFSGIVVLPQEKLGEFSAAPLALLRTISVPVQE